MRWTFAAACLTGIVLGGADLHATPITWIEEDFNDLADGAVPEGEVPTGPFYTEFVPSRGDIGAVGHGEGKVLAFTQDANSPVRFNAVWGAENVEEQPIVIEYKYQTPLEGRLRSRHAVLFDDGHLSLYMQQGSTFDRQRVFVYDGETIGTYEADTWYTVRFTLNPVTDAFKIDIDGVGSVEGQLDEGNVATARQMLWISCVANHDHDGAVVGLLDDVSVIAVPEPGSLGLMGLGALYLLRRR
ncbi:PEP-CTERM sorting domain-containing protein [Phycisphaerales bacterium AB-hyl4]|uniref:PEP-CTERM sorting domain-containing protein n=1 Tax=Natronomicrosphaera hydrolytica TaxID=3242702 RepID=A0ABV4U6W9_9BACT